MIRVKIQYGDDSATKRLLRFDPSIDFEALVQKIASKLDLKLPASGTGVTNVLRLSLEGDAEVQETSEIEHGDSLVLSRRTVPLATARVVSQSEEEEEEELEATAVKVEEAEPNEKDGAKDDDDSVVEDATKEMMEKKAAQQKAETIYLSSDPEEEEFNSDDEEDGVNDQESAWEDSDDDEKEFSSSEADDSEDSDFDQEQEEAEMKKASQKRRRSNRPPPESPLQVIMDEKDVPAAPGKRADSSDGSSGGGLEEASMLVDGAGKNKADQAIKDRIIKLLNTGFHSESNEHEARNAMKLAQRLMRKHNLSQAILLKEREARNNQGSNKDEVLKGGMVKVQIVNRKTGNPAQFARWISQLTPPVSKNFGVKCYSQVARGCKTTVVFYGIYTNAQLAGYAFRVATERIAQMTAEYTPPKHSYVSTKSAKLSYAMGVVRGIDDEVDRTIRLEKEQRQRKLQRARLAVSTGEAYEESDNEDDDGEHDNDGPGFSLSSSGVAKKKPGSDSSNSVNQSTNSRNGSDSVENGGQGVSDETRKMTGDDLDNRLQELEKEEQAAIVLVDHGEKVAEDVLKEQDIKLHSSRKRKAIQFDGRSFRQGIEDSKEIDINQRAIRDETRVKKQKKER